MKKAKKALLLALCAVLLVAGSVVGTLAYLTATDNITNTFTVGNVAIELKERKMNTETGALAEGSELVDEINDIKVVPGRTIYKKPVVFVKSGSEDCWLFVKVEGKLLTGGDFVLNNNWEAVEGQDNWYRYKANEGKATANAEGYQVFDSFTFHNLTNEQVKALDRGTINVTAYAIQYELVDRTAAFAAAQGMAESASNS